MKKIKSSMGTTMQLAHLLAILVVSILVGAASFHIYSRDRRGDVREHLSSILRMTLTEVDGQDLKECIETGKKTGL